MWALKLSSPCKFGHNMIFFSFLTIDVFECCHNFSLGLCPKWIMLVLSQIYLLGSLKILFLNFVASLLVFLMNICWVEICFLPLS